MSRMLFWASLGAALWLVGCGTPEKPDLKTQEPPPVRSEIPVPPTPAPAALVATPAPPRTYPLWDGAETVAAYAKRAELEPTKTLDLGDGVKLEVVLIPAGKFPMGSPEPEKERDDGEVRHEVTLTQPFYMGKFEITQEQYKKIMTENPSGMGDAKYPVENVNWENVREFCKKASEKTGATVRLPTEAEWEHACRAGTKTSYATGDSDADLERAGWYRKNSGGTTHPVGQKEANAWGLYDMHGNVSEWCADWGFRPYKPAAETNPQGPAKGWERVLRGGAYNDGPEACRSACRRGHGIELADYFFGFRVAVDVAKAP